MAKRQAKTAKAQPKADRPFAPGYGIVGAADGKGVLPWAWVTRKMNRCRTFWLATIHAGHHRPHVMPVWGVWLDDAFFFSTGRKSRKGQNLAANPACTITNDNGEEAVIIDGDSSRGCGSAGARRSRLHKKIQNGPAQHGGADLHRASAHCVWIHRKEFSEVGDQMEVGEF